jgi:hypothetical protein
METLNATSKTGGTTAKGDTQFFNRTLARVLIQEIPTGRYYRGPGVWAADEAQAFDFQTGSAARECAAKLGLANVQVVMTQEFRQCQIFALKSSLKT